MLKEVYYLRMWIGTKNEDTVGSASCYRRSMYSTPIMAPAGSLNTVGSYITCIINLC